MEFSCVGYCHPKIFIIFQTVLVTLSIMCRFLSKSQSELSQSVLSGLKNIMQTILVVLICARLVLLYSRYSVPVCPHI